MKMLLICTGCAWRLKMRVNFIGCSIIVTDCGDSWSLGEINNSSVTLKILFQFWSNLLNFADQENQLYLKLRTCWISTAIVTQKSTTSMSSPEKLRPEVSKNLPASASDNPIDKTDVRTMTNLISMLFISVFIYLFTGQVPLIQWPVASWHSPCSVLNAWKIRSNIGKRLTIFELVYNLFYMNPTD